MAEAAGASDMYLFWFLGQPALYTMTLVVAVLAGITFIMWVRRLLHGRDRTLIA